MDKDTIAILDFGSQYTNLVRRCITELGVKAEVMPPGVPSNDLKTFAGVILSGGPASVHDPGAPAYDRTIFSLEAPILGVCYGHQLLAQAMGGKVVRGKRPEYGKAILKICEQDALLKGLEETEQVWMSHGDEVVEPPNGFQVLASTESCAVAAMAAPDIGRYGVQFHPEVEHTLHGVAILRNFIFEICKCKPLLSTTAVIDQLLQDIRNQVGHHKVFLLASGGIDSTVAFLLLTRALGQNSVYGLHINTGLLREGETERVITSLIQFGLNNFHVVDASRNFLEGLRGVTDPETKRRIVAATFLQVKDQAMRELNLDPSLWLLGQGTIYPDLIASGVTEHSQTIKTHHNSLLRERSNFTIVEPLKLLYKDQVRRLGISLGLPDDFVWKEPFPGPGLSIRVLGQVTQAKLSLQRHIDVIIEECLRPTPWFRKLWHRFPVLAIVSDFEPPVLHANVLGQPTLERAATADTANRILVRLLAANQVQYDHARCILLPLKTVGIKGDARSYEAPLSVHVIRQGTFAALDQNLLEQLRFELTGAVRGINRVVYDITPVAEITAMNSLTFLRLITSRDAMTADWAALEYPLLETISKRIVTETGVDRVMLDITQKPPGMMEWE